MITTILKKGFDPSNIPTDFDFTPGTSPEAVQLAYDAIDYGCLHANNIQTVRQQGLELGSKFKAFEEATSKSELHRLLKHYYPKDLVRYYRNLVAQAKILDKLVITSENPSGNRYDLVLNMPVCHASALLTAKESQIEEILTAIATKKQVKWTLRLIQEQIKSQPEPTAKPTLAEGMPIKIRLETEEVKRGTIGWVESMEEEEGGVRTVQVQLVGGDKLDHREHHVEPLDPTTFSTMVNTVALISRLRAGLKAVEDKDAGEENELEARISKLNKSRIALSTKLGLTEWAVEGLAKNLPTVNLDEAIAPGNECDQILGVFGIVDEDAKEAVLAKARMLVRLSNPVEQQCLPTVGCLTEAIAQYLFKATKKERHGIPMSTRDYNEVTSHMQWQHNEILELRSALASRPKEPGQEVYEQLEAERRLKDRFRQENILLTEKLELLESAITTTQETQSGVESETQSATVETLSLLVQELQQQNAELMARLAEMEKAIAQKSSLEAQLEELQKQLSAYQKASQETTTKAADDIPQARPQREFEINDVVRILNTHPIEALRGKIGKFQGIEKQDNGAVQWYEARIFLDEGGEYPHPVFVRHWLERLEWINITPEELVEINRAKATASKFVEQENSLKWLREQASQLKELSEQIAFFQKTYFPEIDGDAMDPPSSFAWLQEKAMKAKELEEELLAVKATYSPEKIAAKLSKTLAPILGETGVSELAESSKKGLNAVWRYLKTAIAEPAF